MNKTEKYSIYFTRSNKVRIKITVEREYSQTNNEYMYNVLVYAKQPKTKDFVNVTNEIKTNNLYRFSSYPTKVKMNLAEQLKHVTLQEIELTKSEIDRIFGRELIK